MAPENDGIGSRKALLRQRLKGALSSLDSDSRRALSARVRCRLNELHMVRDSRFVLGYSPLADEPDIWPWIQGRVAARLRTALLRFEKDAGEYLPVEIHGEDRELREGRFGVREPESWCSVVPWNQLDLVLVPGLGFDMSGVRLGRGRGFYDRVLARVSATTCGVAFEEQLCPEIPLEAHDVMMDFLVTPERLMSFAPPHRGAAARS